MSAFRIARSFIVERPRVSAAVTAFLLSGSGDAIGQCGEQRRDGDRRKPYSLKRSIAQGLFSSVYASQLYVPWVRFLDTRFGSAMTLRSAFLKMGCDNLVLCPLVGLPLYYAWTSAAAGHSTQQAEDRVRTGYWNTLVGSWCIWVPIQLTNYRLVPLPFRVVFMYVGEIAWAVMASFVSRDLPAAAREEIS
jgi:hypothetical protein